MATLNPQQLLQIKSGADIADKMPYIRDDIERMMHTVQTQAYSAIANHSMTPELAYSLWLELNAYHRLLKKLQQRVTVGKSVAETHITQLNIGDE